MIALVEMLQGCDFPVPLNTLALAAWIWRPKWMRLNSTSSRFTNRCYVRNLNHYHFLEYGRSFPFNSQRGLFCLYPSDLYLKFRKQSVACLQANLYLSSRFFLHDVQVVQLRLVVKSARLGPAQISELSNIGIYICSTWCLSKTIWCFSTRSFPQ